LNQIERDESCEQEPIRAVINTQQDCPHHETAGDQPQISFYGHSGALLFCPNRNGIKIKTTLVPLICPPILLNLDGELRNVTQSDGDRCANSPARAGKIAKVTSFQDGNDLACGLQTINPEAAEGL
jgi:hypothetical protein